MLLLFGACCAALGYALSTASEWFREARRDAKVGLDYSMEWRLWSAFAAQPAPSLPQSIDPDFPRFLADAYGYDTPKGIAMVEIGRQALPGGRLSDLRLTVLPAGFALRALHATHDRPSEAVAIVMHGYQSTADKVMGEDTPDYMDEVGLTLYMAGTDVLALDMPSDPAIDAAMNLKLLSLGMTVDGAWARAACDAAAILRLRQRHAKVLLYAVQRATRTAEIFSVLCEPVGRILLEPATFDRRQAVRHDLKRRALMQPLMLATRTPLLSRDSFANFAAHSQSPITYIQTEAAWAEIEDAVDESFSRVDFNAARAGVILRKFDTRVANRERVDRLIRGAGIANRTIGLEPR
ncbi:MAG: hypothetical protein AB7G39_05910 [Alphaproteobacteria bacterium]